MRNWFFFVSLAPLTLIGLPKEANVVSGRASLSQPDSKTLVIEPSDRAVINYSQFNVAKDETVHFKQKSAHSTVLNRVKGSNPSEIFGQIRSNGKVFLINPNGILFGPNSQVNVGSIIASTLDLDDKEFSKGNYHFRLDPKAKKSQIVNRGTINVEKSGYAVLIAPHIFNEGVISATAGKVALLAGESVTLDFSGDGLMSFTVEGELESAVIEHLGKISASEGEIFIRLKTADKLMKSVVNIDGFVVGSAIEKENGTIRIVGKSQIEANRIELAGRNIEVSGEVVSGKRLHIQAKESARIRHQLNVGNLSVEGKTIVLSAPIECTTLKLEASQSFQIGADIKAKNGSINFGSPVVFTAPDVTISTEGKESGIIFNALVDSDPRFMEVNLTLNAGMGSILFNAPVGSLGKLSQVTIADAGNVTAASSIRVGGFTQNSGTGRTTFNGPIEIDGAAGLYLNSYIININNALTTKNGGGVTVINSGPFKVAERFMMNIDGQFNQKGSGEVIFGSKLISNGNISFESSVRLFDTIELNAAQGTGDVVFHGNVEGPGGLNITCGNLIFNAHLGNLSPLSNLKAVSSSSITLGNVGGERPGITDGIDLNAKDAIHFCGKIIHADTQNYLASKYFNMMPEEALELVSSHPNAPIVFKKAPIHMLSGSGLKITTANGDIKIEEVCGTSMHNLSLNAGDGKVSIGGIGNGGEVGHLSITGSEIALNDAVTARSLTLNGKTRLVKGRLNTTFGDMVFSGPVVIETLKASLSSGENGNIIFDNSLNGKGELELAAYGGTVRFNGPVGFRAPFSALSVGGKVIDQNSDVNTTGPVVYNGKEIYLGGKIKTLAGAIEFVGPVIRDNVDTVSLRTEIFDPEEGKSRSGNVVFKSTLDTDQSSRDLFIDATNGIVKFEGIIGGNTPLKDLRVTAKTVEFNDIGSDKAGVANILNIVRPSNLDIEVKTKAYFHGKTYHAGEQRLGADVLVADFQGETQFISDSRSIEFGQIEPSNGTHLAVNTRGGGFKLSSLKAPSLENITVNTGSGVATILEIENTGHVNVVGGSIAVLGKIQASTIHFEAANTIESKVIDRKSISATGDVYLNAKGSYIGGRGRPFWVETEGKIYIGAKSEAHIKGSSSDGMLHSIPSNRPDFMSFNGFEYYDHVFDTSLPLDEEEMLSLTPDLFTHVPGGYAHGGIVKPRKALIYYKKQVK